MSYETRVKNEIYAIIEARKAKRLPLKGDWIAHQVCDAHKAGLARGEDGDFWKWAGYRAVRELTRKCISEMTDGAPLRRDPQPRLPGYEHLQEYYSVERRGDMVAIHREHLTDHEIEAKADEHRKMGAGHHAHADELERWKSDPRRKAIA